MTNYDQDEYVDETYTDEHYEGTYGNTVPQQSYELYHADDKPLLSPLEASHRSGRDQKRNQGNGRQYRNSPRAERRNEEYHHGRDDKGDSYQHVEYINDAYSQGQEYHHKQESKREYQDDRCQVVEQEEYYPDVNYGEQQEDNQVYVDKEGLDYQQEEQDQYGEPYHVHDDNATYQQGQGEYQTEYGGDAYYQQEQEYNDEEHEDAYQDEAAHYSNQNRKFDDEAPSTGQRNEQRQQRLLQQAWGEESSTLGASSRTDQTDEDEREFKNEDDWGSVANVHLSSVLSPEHRTPSPLKSPTSSRRGKVGTKASRTPPKDDDDSNSSSSSLQYSLPSRSGRSSLTTGSGGSNSKGNQVSAEKKYTKSHSSPYDHKSSSPYSSPEAHQLHSRSPSTGNQPWGRVQHVRSYQRSKTWEHNEHIQKGLEDVDSYHLSTMFSSPPNSLSSVKSTGSNSGQKVKVVVPVLNLDVLKQPATSKKRSPQNTGADDDVVDQIPCSPSKKKKGSSFVAGILESICDEKKTMQDEWESKIFVDDTALVDHVFDPRVRLSIKEEDVTLLEVYMYLGCVDEMMDLYLAYPTERFIQYVAQASEQYSIIMQGNSMQHEECIRTVALNSLFRECQMTYLIEFYDFSEANSDGNVIEVLKSVSIDDIIYKYPFVSYTSYALSYPLPNPLPEDEEADGSQPDGSFGSKERKKKGFWSQILWLFDTLNRLHVTKYGQLMTYTTGVFQGHSLFSDKGELRKEYIDKVLSEVGGSYIKKLLRAQESRDSKKMQEFIARSVLLSSPIKLDTYYYECCKHGINGSGYKDYANFGPSVGGFLLYVETEWSHRISDLLQLMSLGHAHKLPEFSTYYQVKSGKGTPVMKR